MGACSRSHTGWPWSVGPLTRESLDERIQARFLKSAPTLAECPDDGVAEVAILGRSNAGKSSVLNQLTGNRHLARTSKTPGRTRLINFFDTDRGGRLVDLPGYGYARASHAERHVWQREVERYLEARDPLCALVLVTDCRHPFHAFDQHMLGWARAAALPALVLLNKADKLAHGARTKCLRDAERFLREQPHTQAILFSAATGDGRKFLIDWLSERLAAG